MARYRTQGGALKFGGELAAMGFKPTLCQHDANLRAAWVPPASS